MEKKRNVEILAPAGEMESLKGAVLAGCDAVYVGGSRFGARASAVNFTEKALTEAIDYVHIHGKQLYLTVNTLFKENELEKQLYSYMCPYYEAGLDGVIVQDLGVLSFLHKEFPGLPLHASTQMTLMGTYACEVLMKLGVNRIVPSRELSIGEIKELKQKTGLELECFVQGALCVCYSGQCLMSSLIGGRSGNRGRCAQPCRKPYEISFSGGIRKRGSYPLSPKDLCTLSGLPDLIEAGIDSFKIEGRMKKPEYAAFTSFLYRKYADLYLERGRKAYGEFLLGEEYRKDMLDLQDLYNRGGFTKGYYHQYNGKDMMSSLRPNHFGVLAGKVEAVKGQGVSIRLLEDIGPLDVLEIRDQKTQASLLGRTVPKEGGQHKKGDKWEITLNRREEKLIAAGQPVYRTRKQGLIDQISRKRTEGEKGTVHKQQVKGFFKAETGKTAVFTLSLFREGREAFRVCAEGSEVGTARNQPLLPGKIEDCLRKIQDLPFEYETLLVETGENIFMPVGQINAVRRQAFEKLQEQLVEAFRRKGQPDEKKQGVGLPEAGKLLGRITEEAGENGKSGAKFRISIASREQLDAVLSLAKEREDWKQSLGGIAVLSVYFTFSEITGLLQKIKKQLSGIPAGLVLPPVFRQATEKKWETYTDLGAFDFYRVKNMEELVFIKKKCPGKAIEADYSLYCTNSRTRKVLYENGIESYTANVELNQRELKELGIRDASLFVYGYLPLMQTAQCLVKNNIGCAGNSQEYQLKDEKQEVFYGRNFCGKNKGGVLSDCLNLIYNGKPVSLLGEGEEIRKLAPRWLQLDFTREGAAKVKNILLGFYEIMAKDGIKNIPSDWNTGSITKGHFRRGME